MFKTIDLAKMNLYICLIFYTLMRFLKSNLVQKTPKRYLLKQITFTGTSFP